jgi:hypothetical protein
MNERKRGMMKTFISYIFFMVWCGLSTASASDMVPAKGDEMIPKKSYSPYAGESYPKDVYWGDTHLHTSNSFDAGFINFRVGVEEAFRFARGEEITANNGMQIKLVRPLDFLVVSDHAEYLGLTPALRASDPLLLKTEAGARWNKALKSGKYEQVYKAAMEAIGSVGKGNELIKSEDFKKSMWGKSISTADSMNKPGLFTAFIGYEWTSMPNKGNNLHRVVIFKDDAERAGKVVPFSMFDSEDPEDLWNFLAMYEEKTGGNILAIPHNGNISNGTMFAIETFKGKKLNKRYAETRAMWEPLYEITQIKGDGETHPALSPNDEFADFGTWDKGNLTGSIPKEPSMLQYEYAREALKNGLKLEAELGVNPFKFGVVGSTDSHTGLATAKENNFFGKHSGLEPDTHRAVDHKVLESPIDEKLTTWGWEQIASGLAAVWATENTRGALFEAMERKETYATTGSRISLRFFGGWDFQASDLQQPAPAKVGYFKGVPMGGDLTNGPKGKAPSFMLWALRDPEGANLDRLQIVKGWLDDKGKTHEKVFDVAWADDRKRGSDGKIPAVGNTVEIKNATYTNTIGDVYLATVWNDPEFNPNEKAFYYARVIEIPTPSWLAFDAKFFKVNVPKEAKMIIQERAYSSPIWYTP